MDPLLQVFPAMHAHSLLGWLHLVLAVFLHRYLTFLALPISCNLYCNAQSLRPLFGESDPAIYCLATGFFGEFGIDLHDAITLALSVLGKPALFV